MTKQEDYDLLVKLKRVTRPIQSEIDEIYYLYKKYIDENADMYCTSCNGVGYNSITKYYFKIIQLDLK